MLAYSKDGELKKPDGSDFEYGETFAEVEPIKLDDFNERQHASSDVDMGQSVTQDIDARSSFNVSR